MIHFCVALGVLRRCSAEFVGEGHVQCGVVYRARVFSEALGVAVCARCYNIALSVPVRMCAVWECLFVLRFSDCGAAGGVLYGVFCAGFCRWN